MARARSLTDATFRDAVVGSPQPVLVFFWAHWNATCKAFAPTINDLAGEYEGRVVVARLEVDANPVIPAMFGVTAVPQLLLFVGGQAQWRIVGYRRIEVIRDQVEESLADAADPHTGEAVAPR
jgi:thioredoxin 1